MEENLPSFKHTLSKVFMYIQIKFTSLILNLFPFYVVFFSKVVKKNPFIQYVLYFLMLTFIKILCKLHKCPVQVLNYLDFRSLYSKCK